MKKNFRIFAALGLVAALGASYSCQKEVTAEPSVLDSTKTVTLHLMGYADTDLTQAGKETADSAKVLVTADYSSYYYLPNTPKGKWSKVVTLVKGKADVVIPSTSAGVDVTVTPLDFTAVQKQVAGAPLAEIKTTFTSAAGIITAPFTNSAAAKIKVGENKYVTIEYGIAKLDPSAIGAIQTATYHGTVFADLDLTKIGQENVTGKSVLIEGKNADATKDWQKVVAITDGKFDVVLPVNKGETITITPLDFSATQKQAFDVKTGSYPADSLAAFKLDKEWSGSLVAGTEVYNKFTFSKTMTIGSTVKMVTVKGKANIVLTYEGKSTPYSGKIIFYTDETANAKKWTLDTKIDQLDGSFTIEVPANCSIKATMTGIYNEGKIMVGGTMSTSDIMREYIYTATVGSFSAPKTFDNDFTLNKETRNN